MTLLPASQLVLPRTWRRSDMFCSAHEDFFISTEQNLIQPKAVNAAFAMDFLYWAKPLPETVLEQLLRASICVGLYKCSKTAQGLNRPDFLQNGHSESGKCAVASQSSDDAMVKILPSDAVEQVGLARIITDTVSFAYLTDVYVLPDYQGRGFGKWLMDCVAEILSPSAMPHLRRVMLMTSSRESDGGRAEDFYAAELGMTVIGHDEQKLAGKKLSLMCWTPGSKS